LSAVLTFCSTKSLPSGPERAAHFARERPQSSVVAHGNQRREITSDTYALKRRGGKISFELYTAYFGSKRAQSSVGKHSIRQ
jgi:hypothetical protein